MDLALFEAYTDKVPYTPLGAYLRLGETHLGKELARTLLEQGE